MNMLLRFALPGLVAFALAACDGGLGIMGGDSQQAETALEHAEKHLDPSYVCPMHPNVVRDAPGTCPICGMDLVEKKPQPTRVKNETAVEHAEKHLDPNYVCPMHPNIVRDAPGTCPICGMDLVKKEPQAEAGGGTGEILYYRHPHNPTITSDKPMKDEMGMDYIPVYDDGGGSAVKISPVVEHNMNVRTARATRDTLWRKINTVGYVDFDEDRIAHIHLRTEGWIEKLMVKSEGERVGKGDLLFELYSPDLVNAQEELIQALNTGNRQLIRASRERLQALGISDDQIERLQKTRRVQQYVKIYAPQDGIVAQLNVRQGMFVTPKMEVMSLADLSSVWLLAEVFERQANWVEEGQPAEVTLSYLPGKVWEGEVEFIYPSLNPRTRTLKARLRFDNPEEQLKPNMFADVAIYAGPRRDVIVIPREALIRTGEEQRVIVAIGEGRFAPREVVAGIESGDWVEIQSGLKPGERVVTSGQFLIDSEASLKASLQRMQSGATGQQAPADDTAPVTASGVLEAVDAASNTVNMTHDPIPALDWPQMTMDFKVRDTVPLESFSSGERVEFELEEGESGYVITDLHRREQ